MGLLTEEIGGGSYFGADSYYTVGRPNRWYADRSSGISSMLRPSAVSAEEFNSAANGLTQTQFSVAEPYAFGGGQLYVVPSVPNATKFTGGDGLTYVKVNAPPSTRGFMSQTPIPEYEIEKRASVGKNLRDAEESGYSDRALSKIKQLGRTTNKSISEMNAAKREHVELAKSVNEKIGKPDSSAYKGFTHGSVNQAIAYAMDKAEDMAASTPKHVDAAIAQANAVKADAATKGAALQAKFDSVGGQVVAAKNMREIIGHIMGREQNDGVYMKRSSSSMSQPQPTSVLDQNSAGIFTSISDWLKT